MKFGRGGRRILYFFKKIIAHKNSLQVFNRFNDIDFSIIFQSFFMFLITITGLKNFKNIQEHSVQIQEHSRVLKLNHKIQEHSRLSAHCMNPEYDIKTFLGIARLNTPASQGYHTSDKSGIEIPNQSIFK